MADFLADLLPIRRILVDGTIQTGVRDIDFDGATFTVTLNDDGTVLSIESSGAAANLADAAPPTIAAASAIGVSTDCAREDHTHAHGGASAATVSTLALRDGSGNCAFVGLTATSLNSAAGLAIGASATGISVGVLTTGTVEILGLEMNIDSGANGMVIAGSTCPDLSIGNGSATLQLTASTCSTDYNALVCDVDTTITLRDGGTDRAVITTAAAFTVVLDDGLSSFDLSWQADAAGAGADTTVTTQAGLAGSANGKLRLKNPSGNTALGGGVIVDVGSLVSNVSDPFAIETNGTRLLSVLQPSANTVLVRNSVNTDTLVIGGSTGASANHLAIAPASSVTLAATAGYMYQYTVGVPFYISPAFGVQLGVTTKAFFWIPSTVTISSATTTTLLSWTTTSNRGYQVVAEVTVSNDTDNEIAVYHLRAAFRNVAGTVTQAGTTIVTVVGEDAGQTGLDATIDFSGTSLRVRLVSDSADTLTVETVFSVVNVVVIT